MNTEIVGREQELASLRAFIDAGRRRPAALVLEGEPGIGKSTLWLAGVEEAAARGLRVLAPGRPRRSAGSPTPGSEICSKAFSATCCRPSRPLGGARSRSRCSSKKRTMIPSTTGHSLSQSGTSWTCSSDREPVVVAVDDVQWLDPSSAARSAFALRRLEERTSASCLPGGSSPERGASELESSSGRLERRRARAAQRRRGPPAAARPARPSFARQTLLRIHERSGGNPFFALEIARALDRDLDPLEPLPVPQTLEELVRVRLTGLPPETRDALALAAAIGTPSELLLRAGRRPGGCPRARRSQHTSSSATRDDPLHASAALVGRSTTISGTSGGAFTRESPMWSTTRSSARATSRCPGRRQTPRWPPGSTRRRASPRAAAPPPRRPSSPSKRSGSPRPRRGDRAPSSARRCSCSPRRRRVDACAVDPGRPRSRSGDRPLRAEGLMAPGRARVRSTDPIPLLEEALGGSRAPVAPGGDPLPARLGGALPEGFVGPANTPRGARPRRRARRRRASRATLAVLAVLGWGRGRPGGSAGSPRGRSISLTAVGATSCVREASLAGLAITLER